MSKVNPQTIADDKRFATLRAELALRGYALHRTADVLVMQHRDEPVHHHIHH